ncbi:unnamed protein product, partial [marine sediment metagenome]
AIYSLLPFPVFLLEYLIEPKDFGTRIEPHMGRPSLLSRALNRKNSAK